MNSIEDIWDEYLLVPEGPKILMDTVMIIVSDIVMEFCVF